MRAVLDTNVVVSALFWRGPPRQVLDAARSGHVKLATSPDLLGELREVLARPRFARTITASGLSVDQLADDYEHGCVVVPAPPLPQPVVVADPDDDAVLACAAAVGADVIVSGDQDLLVLGTYQGIPIITAAEFLVRLAAAGPGTCPIP